jgi:AmmeMemoRadiSam system protein B
MSIRKTVVSGSFYPNDKEELLNLIGSFSNPLEFTSQNRKNDFEHINAIITPHAGYIYSGKLSNTSYSLTSIQNLKRVVVIGPSHHAYFEGSSICLDDEYETPLGNIEIDIEFSKNLINRYDFLSTNEECAFEHSTETQAPFIKHYFPNTKIVEIIYANQDFNSLSNLIDEVLDDEENLLVISTDLSHFYSLDEANKLDENCIEGINKKDISILENCEACGKIGIKALLKSAIKKSLKSKILDYYTSYDINNDKSRVVGYTTALIGK